MVPDVSMIGGAVSSLQAAVGIAKSLIGVSEAVAVNAKAAELLGVIADAQAKLIDAQNEIFELQRQLNEARGQLGKKADFDRYELVEIHKGKQVYRLMTSKKKEGEPDHYICPRCKDADGVLSILQAGETILACPKCASKYRYKDSPPPAVIGNRNRFI